MGKGRDFYFCVKNNLKFDFFFFEYSEKTTDLPQDTNKLYHIILYRVNLAWMGFVIGIVCILLCIQSETMIRRMTNKIQVTFWLNSICYLFHYFFYQIARKGPSWSYGSWIYNYLCNQCLLPLKLCCYLGLGLWWVPG
jgi:hypothetical protein